MVYATQVCWHIPLLCVQWKTPVDGQRNCPKQLEFYFKNKFEKLVHLVGLIIRMNAFCYNICCLLLQDSYVFWTVHHLHSGVKRDQLDVTCFIISLFNAQHVSNVNTTILRSLRLICWDISWVVLIWFDVCWCYVVVTSSWSLFTQLFFRVVESDTIFST